MSQLKTHSQLKTNSQLKTLSDVAIMFAVKITAEEYTAEEWVEPSKEASNNTHKSDVYAHMYRIANHQDKASFEKLYWEYAPKIKSYMKRHGAADSLAEELSQETLFSVWQKAKYYKPDISCPSTWIFRIARNLYIDKMRKQKHFDSESMDSINNDFSSELGNELKFEHSFIDDIDNKKMLGRMKKALSSEQFKVLDLTFFSGMNQSEISQRLSIPIGTVKSRMRLAYERLRTVFEDSK